MDDDNRRNWTKQIRTYLLLLMLIITNFEKAIFSTWVSDRARLSRPMMRPLLMNVFSRVLRDSSPRFVGPSVGRLVGLLLFRRFKAVCAHCSFPNAILSHSMSF